MSTCEPTSDVCVVLAKAATLCVDVLATDTAHMATVSNKTRTKSRELIRYPSWMPGRSRDWIEWSGSLTTGGASCQSCQNEVSADVQKIIINVLKQHINTLFGLTD